MKKLCVRQIISSAQGYRSAVFCAVRKGAIADKEQTGYLKKLSERFDGELVYLTLVVPNTEVKLIYRNTILDWFSQSIKKKDFSALYSGLGYHTFLYYGISFFKKMCRVMAE